MHNVDLLVSIPRFFFRNHGCQEDPLNKPVIAGYFFLRLKIKQFQLQSKIECEIVWNLSWIYFLPTNNWRLWAHDFGSEILGSKNLMVVPWSFACSLAGEFGCPALCHSVFEASSRFRWLACSGDPNTWEAIMKDIPNCSLLQNGISASVLFKKSWNKLRLSGFM